MRVSACVYTHLEIRKPPATLNEVKSATSLLHVNPFFPGPQKFLSRCQVSELPYTDVSVLGNGKSENMIIHIFFP